MSCYDLQCWENCIILCRELANQYEAYYDYRNLSKMRVSDWFFSFPRVVFLSVCYCVILIVYVILWNCVIIHFSFMEITLPSLSLSTKLLLWIKIIARLNVWPISGDSGLFNNNKRLCWKSGLIFRIDQCSNEAWCIYSFLYNMYIMMLDKNHSKS